MAYGDSGCLDGSYQVSDCYSMLKGILDYSTGRVDLTESSDYLSALLDPTLRLETALGSDDTELPERFKGFNFTEASFVLQQPLTCYKNSPGSVDSVTAGAPPRTIESNELPLSIPTNPDLLSNTRCVAKVQGATWHAAYGSDSTHHRLDVAEGSLCQLGRCIQEGLQMGYLLLRF